MNTISDEQVTALYDEILCVGKHLHTKVPIDPKAIIRKHLEAAVTEREQAGSDPELCASDAPTLTDVWQYHRDRANNGALTSEARTHHSQMARTLHVAISEREQAEQPDDDQASDVPVWTLIEMAERCGAVKDASDDASFWTITLDGMYALERALRAVDVSVGFANAAPQPSGSAVDQLPGIWEKRTPRHAATEAAYKVCADELRDAIRTPSPCPYIVHGSDGTSHCRLAESAGPSSAQVPETMPKQPDGYAYRYPDAWGSGRSVIKFNDGRELNGSKPIEAIPYYFGTPPSAEQ